MILEYIVLYRYYGKEKKLYKKFNSNKDYCNYRNWMNSARGYTNVRFLKKKTENKNSIDLDKKKKTKSTKNVLLSKMLSDKKELKFYKFIYALIKGDSIVYIGQSGNIQSRLLSHQREGLKDFDYWSVVARLPYEIDSKGLNDLEEKYIKMFKPKYNLTHNVKKVL